VKSKSKEINSMALKAVMFKALTGEQHADAA
jgi:hypothetical protein